MKRIGIVVIIVALILNGCIRNVVKNETTNATTTALIKYNKAKPSAEMRAVWLSFYELSMKDEHGGNALKFRSKICKMFDNIVNEGFNTVFVHIRPYSDAYYPSEIFPWSKYFAGIQGLNPGYDPMQIMIQEAKSRNISIHAWINPFRVSVSANIKNLSKTNPARKWLEDKDPSNDSNVVVLNSGIYYNPASPEVHKLIIDGVKEILRNYDVGGIHLDDYFYPSQEKKIDGKQYGEYTKNGGKMNLDDWRRANIDTFISGLYSTVKSAGKNKTVSISPAGNLENNYNALYVNIPEWVQNEGYTDYIIPQLYFGFENEYCPFKETANQWSNLVTSKNVKVVWGLGIYKSGICDNNAGKSEKALKEWIKNEDIIERQVEYVRTLTRYDGFALFSYNYAFSQNSSVFAKNEMHNLENVL